MALVGQHDSVVQDSFGADGIWDAVAQRSNPGDELAPGHRITLDELEDPGEAPTTSQQSSHTPHADMAASRDFADSASVSAQNTPAGAGGIVQSTRQDSHNPKAPLHPANRDPAVAMEGDDKPVHVSPVPRATGASGPGGDASELDAGSAKVPKANPEVITIAVFDLNEKDPEGNTASPCEQRGIQRIPLSTANQGSDDSQPSVTSSLVPSHDEGQPALVATPESAEDGSVPVRSPSSQATCSATATTSANTGVHTTSTNTNDPSTRDLSTDQVGIYPYQTSNECDGNTTKDTAPGAPTLSVGAGPKSPTARSSGRLVHDSLTVANRLRSSNRHRILFRHDGR